MIIFPSIYTIGVGKVSNLQDLKLKTQKNKKKHLDALSDILTRISQAGKSLIVVASGNYGWQGPFSARAPASAPEVLTVGSVNAIYSVQSRPRASFSVQNRTSQTSQSADFAWAPATPGRFPSSLPLQTTTLNTSVTNDACSIFGNDVQFSNMSVVLVRRGGC